MSSPSTASLSVGRGLGVGPASTSPVGEKTPAWHGQKKRVLSGSHLMIQPRCVQTRERPWYVPSWSCRSVLGVSWYSKSTTLPKGVNSLVDATRTRVAASAWTVGKSIADDRRKEASSPQHPAEAQAGHEEVTAGDWGRLSVFSVHKADSFPAAEHGFLY